MNNLTRKDTMAQQYQFTSTDRTGGGSAGKNEFSTGSKTGLDSAGHRSNNVRAFKALASSPQAEQGEIMQNIRLLNIDQVCAALNMGRVKVYELINRKRLKSVKIGARRLVSARALSDFIKQLEEDYGSQGKW